MPKYILEMENITKSFPGVKVLQGVTLQIQAGEVHALMGENGAGKSTLMKILMGIYTPDEGSMKMHGRPMVNKGPKDAMQHGISMIHQELNPVRDMMVFENVFMGREPRTPMRRVDKRRMIAETRRLLADLNIAIDALAYMRDLSVAQCQLIEIVKAISVGAKVIIMDEPTSAITDREVDTLFEQIARLRQQGVAMIYISHKMDEIFRICDRITVLRDGQFIGCDEARNLGQQTLIRMMVGRDITDVFPKADAEIGEVILEAKDIQLGRKVRDVSFQLRRGEVLGIAGLVGAGRSELVETIFGIRHKTGGQIFKNGRELRITHPRHAIRNGIALITEDRKTTGLDLIASVQDNITMASLGRVSRGGLLHKNQEKKAARRYIQALRVKAPDEKVLAGNLSGGNQQKVVIAKWLMTEPDVIILDEPTRGIDVGAKRDIYLLIGEFVKQGKAVIMISSEIPEIMGLSDRVLVMAGGRLTGELTREEFSQERIMTYAAQFGKE